MNSKWIIIISITMIFLSLASVAASDVDYSTIDTSSHECIAVDNLNNDSNSYESLDINGNMPDLSYDNSHIDDDGNYVDTSDVINEKETPNKSIDIDDVINEKETPNKSIDIDDVINEKETPDETIDINYVNKKKETPKSSANDKNDYYIHIKDIPTNRSTLYGYRIIINMIKISKKLKESPGSFTDLQNLINNQADGSTLVLDRDYKAIGDEQNTVLNKNLIIEGRGHIIDCSSICRAFITTAAVTIHLKCINFINGYADGYTGSSTEGGAIWIGNGAKYIIDSCVFINNCADDYGGAIYHASNVPLTIKNCIFHSNTAEDSDGGAIYSCGSINVYDSTFTGNHAYTCGGAIYIRENGNVYDSTFTINYAIYFGGAIYGRDLGIHTSTFTNNYAENGGAIYAEFEDEIKNCIFYFNSAWDDGGAIYVNFASNVNINNCTFYGNHAGDEGGAIYLDSTNSHLVLNNNVILKNFASEGQAVYNKGFYDYVCNNWWGDVNPSPDNDILVEYKFWRSNIHHVDSDPLKMVMELSKKSGHVGDIIRATVYFIKSDGSRYNGALPINNFVDFSMDGLRTIYISYGMNSAIVDFVADRTGTYDIIAEFYGQRCQDRLVIYDSKLSDSGIYNDNAKGKYIISKDFLAGSLSNHKIYASNNRNYDCFKSNGNSLAFKSNGDSIYESFGDALTYTLPVSNPMMKNLDNQQFHNELEIFSIILSIFGL